MAAFVNGNRARLETLGGFLTPTVVPRIARPVSPDAQVEKTLVLIKPDNFRFPNCDRAA